MTAFQWIVLPLLVMLMVLTAVATVKSRVTHRWGTVWMMLWLSMTIAVAAPELLVRIAHWLGIGRGTDLALYASILFLFAAIFLLYLRYLRVTEQLTSIIRHIAISDAMASRDAKTTEPAVKESV